MRVRILLGIFAAVLLAPPQTSAADDPCVTATVNMVGVCGTFVTKVQNDAKFLSAANDEQIKGAAAQGVQPSVQCCNVYRDFLGNECNCNKAVLALASTQQTDPASVSTQTRIWKASCGFDDSLDKCPPVAAPASTLAAVARTQAAASDTQAAAPSTPAAALDTLLG